MTEKLNEYQGVAGRLHSAKERYRERLAQWKEEHPRGIREVVRETFFGIPSSDDAPERVAQDGDVSEYNDLFR